MGKRPQCKAFAGNLQAEALARATLCSASGAPTTAQPRPQTYVPEALGIPKPYGGFSLFKPSGPGGVLRHAGRIYEPLGLLL